MRANAWFKNSVSARTSAETPTFGSVDEAGVRVVERAGFEGAYCNRPGINDPAAPGYTLGRVEVRGTDSLLGFALALWRGRRWT